MHWEIMGSGHTKYKDSIAPLANGEGYFCVAFRSKKDIDLIHAPEDIQDIFINVIHELWHKQEEPYERVAKGTLQLELPNDDDVIQALFTIRMLEELHVHGYDLVTSSILDSHNSLLTWFFRKRGPGVRRPLSGVVAVTTSGSDGMFIVRDNQEVNRVIREVITDAWPFGVISEKNFDYDQTQETVQYYRLTGYPWAGNRMILELVRHLMAKMGEINWKFLAKSNFNNSSDVLFFVQDSEPSPALHDLGGFADILIIPFQIII